MSKHTAKISARQLVQAFLHYGLRQVVVSPGSRNAPLIIEFSAYPEIEIFSIPDERSAAFFALGLIKALHKPVAVLSTSGSAVLNYYPAVAEAYNSALPLLVISADRPANLIGVGEGQTIFQHGVMASHTGTSIHLNENDAEENIKSLHTAFQTLISKPVPVHINMAFDEPLYDTVEEPIPKYAFPPLHEAVSPQYPPEYLSDYAGLWNRAEKKMILVSGTDYDEELAQYMDVLSRDESVVILTENTFQVRHPRFIDRIDQVLTAIPAEKVREMAPDILLTFGGTVISKKIKHFIRNNPPARHWHIDPWRRWDTYGVLTRHFRLSATEFFRAWLSSVTPQASGYYAMWDGYRHTAARRHEAFLKEIPFCDLKVFDMIHRSIPPDTALELANSTVVRYAQLFSWGHHLHIGANRGTSGIDGSSSTAVGRAWATAGNLWLITGDVSFFYDSHAFWNKYVSAGLKIVLINNGGGGIFRFIPGPAKTGALELFETPHHLTAEHIARHYGLDYLKAEDEESFQRCLTALSNTRSTVIAEVFTPRLSNAEILQSYFDFLCTG